MFRITKLTDLGMYDSSDAYKVYLKKMCCVVCQVLSSRKEYYTRTVFCPLGAHRLGEELDIQGDDFKQP